MTLPDNNTLVTSLVSLTEIHDPVMLEMALVDELSKLVASGRVKLFHVQHRDVRLVFVAEGDNGEHAEARPELARILRTCVNSGDKQEAALSQGYVKAFPLRGYGKQVTAVIVIESENPQTTLHYPADVELKVFHNLIKLINDNERDSLTGLLNRKTFDTRIGKVLMDLKNFGHRAGENDTYRSCFLAVLDIDHFKRVNDQYGHLLGDEVLILFANLMRGVFRDEDLLFRFGGEEFVCVLRNVNLSLAEKALNRLRKAVETYNFPQVGRVTVSVGATEILASELTASIIDRADKALYYAKEHGRNQVRIHETLVSAGLMETRDISGEIELF